MSRLHRLVIIISWQCHLFFRSFLSTLHSLLSLSIFVKICSEMKLSQSIALFSTEKKHAINPKSIRRLVSEQHVGKVGGNAASIWPRHNLVTSLTQRLTGMIRKTWFVERFEKSEHFKAASFQEAFVEPFYASI